MRQVEIVECRRKLSNYDIYLFAYPSILTIHSSIYPFIHPFFALSICPSIHSSICSSNHPSIHLMVQPLFHPSIHSSIHSSIHPSIHPSFHFQPPRKKNRARYTTTEVVCGWAGAVIKNADPSIWAGAVYLSVGPSRLVFSHVIFHHFKSFHLILSHFELFHEF